MFSVLLFVNQNVLDNEPGNEFKMSDSLKIVWHNFGCRNPDFGLLIFDSRKAAW
jgi:hypothetical protein